MKNLLIILSTFITLTISAQENYLVNETKHELIKSIGNPITHINFKNKCDKFYLSTDNGKIETTGNSCIYLIYPERIGIAKISVHKKSGKLIEEKFYKVRDIKFEVYIPGFEKYIDDVEEFSKSVGLQLKSNDLVCWDIPAGIKYKLVIIEDSQKVFQIESNDARFGDDLRSKFKSLKSGNIILFYEIKLIIGEKEIEVPEIVLRIL